MISLRQAIDVEAVGVAILQLAGVLVLAALDPVSSAVAAVALLAFALLAATSPSGGLAAVAVSLPYFFHPLTINQQSFAASELLLWSSAAGCMLRLAFDTIQSRDAAWSVVVGRFQPLIARRYLAILMVGCVLGALLVIWPFDPSAREAA